MEKIQLIIGPLGLDEGSKILVYCSLPKTGGEDVLDMLARALRASTFTVVEAGGRQIEFALVVGYSGSEFPYANNLYQVMEAGPPPPPLALLGKAAAEMFKPAGIEDLAGEALKRGVIKDDEFQILFKGFVMNREVSNG